MVKFRRQVQSSAKPEKIEDNMSVKHIPSGSTLLNCAASDSAFGAYKIGTIVTIPGGSASGKTMLIYTMFAEICDIKRFDKFRLIYDDAEEALSIDIEKLFGKKTKVRVIPPRINKETGDSIYSETIQDFKNNLMLCIKKGIPFIYVLDSLDSLSSDAEMDREYKLAIQSAKSGEQVKEIKGQQIADKARAIGQCLRTIRQQLKNTKGLLVIIQQERTNIGGGMFRPETITSGGRAPFYYSSHQIWLKKSKAIKKGEKKIGAKTRVNIMKNKLTGKERNIEYNIYYSYGIDDIGSQIDFLVQEKIWKKKGGIIVSDEFIPATREKLIRYIEENNLQKKLKKITGESWRKIEKELELTRKAKYLS